MRNTVMVDAQNTSYTLLQRALDRGNEDAWDELVEHYHRFIFYVLHKLNVSSSDLDDLSQRVLVRLLQDLKRYDRTKGRFRSWLSTVVRHLVIDYYREESSYRKQLESYRSDVEVHVLNHPAEVETLIEKEWSVYISNLALERVRRFFQGHAMEVFELTLQGEAPADIAERMKISVQSVYTLRTRVKKRLFSEVVNLREDLEP